jgi:hypothetical protein
MDGSHAVDSLTHNTIGVAGAAALGEALAQTTSLRTVE